MRCTFSIMMLSATALLALAHAPLPRPQQASDKGLDAQADPLAILDAVLASDGVERGESSLPAQDSEPLLDVLAHGVQEELMSLPSFGDQVKKGLAGLPSRLQESFAKYGGKISDAGSRLSDWVHRSLRPSEPEPAREDGSLMGTAASMASSRPSPLPSSPSPSRRHHHIVGKISIKQRISKHVDANGREERIESVPRMKTEFYEVDDAGHFHKLGSEELVGHPVAMPPALAAVDLQQHQGHRVVAHGRLHRHRPRRRHHRHHHGHGQAQASKQAEHVVSAASLSAPSRHHLRPVKLINESEFWIRLGLSVAIGCAFTMLIYSIVKLFVVVFIGIPVDHQEEEEDEEAQKKKLRSAALAPVCKI